MKRLLLVFAILFATELYASSWHNLTTLSCPGCVLTGDIADSAVTSEKIDLTDDYSWTGKHTYGNGLVVKDANAANSATLWGIDTKLTGYDGSYYSPTGIQLWYADPTSSPVGSFDWVDMSGSENVGLTGRFIYTTRGYNAASSGNGIMLGISEEMDDYGSGTSNASSAHSITYYYSNQATQSNTGGTDGIRALTVQTDVAFKGLSSGSVAAALIGTDITTDEAVNTVLGIDQYSEIEGDSNVTESHNLKLFFANDSTLNTVGTAELISASVNPANMDQVANLYGIHFGDFGGCGTSCAAILIDNQTSPSKALVTGTGRVEFGDLVQLVPSASPPDTCNAGNEGALYSDTSHAMCWCDGTTWTKLGGAGTCS